MEAEIRSRKQKVEVETRCGRSKKCKLEEESWKTGSGRRRMWKVNGEEEGSWEVQWGVESEKF